MGGGGAGADDVDVDVGVRSAVGAVLLLLPSPPALLGSTGRLLIELEGELVLEAVCGVVGVPLRCGINGGGSLRVVGSVGLFRCCGCSEGVSGAPLLLLGRDT